MFRPLSHRPFSSYLWKCLSVDSQFWMFCFYSIRRGMYIAVYLYITNLVLSNEGVL